MALGVGRRLPVAAIVAAGQIYGARIESSVISA